MYSLLILLCHQCPKSHRQLLLFSFFIVYFLSSSFLSHPPSLPPSHILYPVAFSAPCVCVSGVVSEGCSGTHTNPQVTNHWLNPSPPTNTLAPHPHPLLPSMSSSSCTPTRSSSTFPSSLSSPDIPFTPLAIHMLLLPLNHKIVQLSIPFLPCCVLSRFLSAVNIFFSHFLNHFLLCLCKLTWKCPCISCSFFLYYFSYVK